MQNPFEGVFGGSHPLPGNKRLSTTGTKNEERDDVDKATDDKEDAEEARPDMHCIFHTTTSTDSRRGNYRPDSPTTKIKTEKHEAGKTKHEDREGGESSN